MILDLSELAVVVTLMATAASTGVVVETVMTQMLPLVEMMMAMVSWYVVMIVMTQTQP